MASKHITRLKYRCSSDDYDENTAAGTTGAAEQSESCPEDQYLELIATTLKIVMSVLAQLS